MDRSTWYDEHKEHLQRRLSTSLIVFVLARKIRFYSRSVKSQGVLYQVSKFLNPVQSQWKFREFYLEVAVNYFIMWFHVDKAILFLKINSYLSHPYFCWVLARTMILQSQWKLLYSQWTSGIFSVLVGENLTSNFAGLPSTWFFYPCLLFVSHNCDFEDTSESQSVIWVQVSVQSKSVFYLPWAFVDNFLCMLVEAACFSLRGRLTGWGEWIQAAYQ